MRKILFGCVALCSTVLMSSSAFGAIALHPWHRACGKPKCPGGVEPVQVGNTLEYKCPSKRVRGLGNVPFCKHYPKNSTTTGTVGGAVGVKPPRGKGPVVQFWAPSNREKPSAADNPQSSQINPARDPKGISPKPLTGDWAPPAEPLPQIPPVKSSGAAPSASSNSQQDAYIQAALAEEQRRNQEAAQNSGSGGGSGDAGYVGMF